MQKCVIKYKWFVLRAAHIGSLDLIITTVSTCKDGKSLLNKVIKAISVPGKTVIMVVIRQ
jgi:hypothetical protein